MTRLRADIAEALSEVEALKGTDADPSEAEEATTPTPGASTGGEPEADTDDGTDPSEVTPEDTEEVPTEYFGLDLSGLEPEQRAAVISELKKRDDHIGKLLRERAPEAEPTSEEPDAEPEEELKDEEILEALGLDPESNPLDETAAKIAVPLVKRQIMQEKLLSQLIEAQELAEIDRMWRSSLSGLEREFGALPKEVDHDAVMAFAAEQGITNPVDAYWRIVGPGRAALTDAMKAAEAAKRLAAKKAATTVRPSTAAAEEDAPLKGATVREATREVAARLLSELGLDT